MVCIEQLTPTARSRRSVMPIVVDATAPTAPSLSRSGTTVSLTGLEPNATWRYSLDSGVTWVAGSGSSFLIPLANASAGQIRASQTDVAGNESTAAQLPAVTLTTTTLITDDFNRANGTALGTATGAAGGWIAAQGSFRIASNMLQAATSTAVAVLPSSSETDVRVEARFDAATMSAGGVVARSSGTGATANSILGYVTRRTSGGTVSYVAEIWRQRNNVWTLLSSATVSSWTGRLQLDCVGASFALSLDGTVATRAFDTSTSAVTSAGTSGLWLTGTTTRADDFALRRLGM